MRDGGHINIKGTVSTARAANLEALHRTEADPAAHRAFLIRTSLLESVRKKEPAA
jgi:3-(3-hydroxy-phenyl)propionate hydroxylase